jgi:hypothetical protein
MASASHITIMRELSAAGDRERTGAFDVEWEGARASLFFIFGHANHVELERAGGERLVGTDALTAIVDELPDEFQVSPWRRAMVTDDTLRCTAEELMFMFRRDPAKSAGRGAADASADEQEPAPVDAGASIPFGLADFPTLPHGDVMFSDSAENVDGLAGAVPHLPDSLIVLDGPAARGAVLVGGGSVVDAVWVDETAGLTGPDAAEAVFNATAGTLTAYRVEDPGVFTEISSLWAPSATPVEAPDAAVAEPDVAELDVAELEVAEPDVAEPDVADLDDEQAVVAEPAGEELEVEASWAADSDPDPSAIAQPAEPETVPETTPRDSAAFFADTRTDRETAVFTLPDASVATAPEAYAPDAFAPDAAAPDAFAPDAVAPDDVAPDVAAEAEPEAVDSADTTDATGDEALAAPPTDDGLTSSAAEFVPARIDVDIDALRVELIGIADVWLGEADAAPVAAAIRAARPGVDDFVAAIQGIASLDIPGHEHAVVRAMAREMHFRAAEVLCGV